MPITLPSVIDSTRSFDDESWVKGTTLIGEEGLTKRRRPLTKKKKILTAVILSAAIATPAFAQNPRLHGSTHHVRSHNDQSVQGENPTALTADERRNLENYGFSGKDPSRVGGEDADLNGVSGN